MRHAADWIVDYAYLIKGYSIMYKHRQPPKHYLGKNIPHKPPIILLPGITLQWSFLKPIGDILSHAGHPVYVAPELKYNLLDIPGSAQIVQKIIKDNHLQHVIIIGHSKGGLVGKYLLVNHNQHSSIKAVIAIATPFEGSSLAKFVRHNAFAEISTESDIIKDLTAKSHVNDKIVSIIPSFDNHVWSARGSFLDGAQNINVSVRGHHKIIFSKEVLEKIMETVNKLSGPN